jgi:long-chain acyl-CoA synthetase
LVKNALPANRLFGAAPHDVHLLALPLLHSLSQTVQPDAGCCLV